ncbi:MAG: HypC/HybG/HupF family hydrogenase formation chaperone [Acidobacteriota bacterium]
MCLGIPAKVIELSSPERGKVEIMGVRREANFSLVEDVKVGDWVILHVGFAISKLDEGEAEETLKLIQEIENAGKS